MASTADQLSALGNDSDFRSRVMALATQYAISTVYVEDPATQNHDLRLGFAKALLFGNPNVNIPAIIAQQTNLVAANTTYDFASSHVVTDASDAAIASQIATAWNMLSGV